MTPTTETWRPVVGYEGLYEVSDQGRVRSLDRRVPHGSGTVFKAGHIMRIGNHDDGRPQVQLFKGGQYKTWLIQTLVLTAFVGPRPGGLHCLHGDGDILNNTPGNLRWGTRSDNTHDSVRHGTHNMARKTECKRGHLLREPNLVPSKRNKGRACLACARAHSKASAVRRWGRSPIDFQAEADAYYRQIMSEAEAA